VAKFRAHTENRSRDESRYRGEECGEQQDGHRVYLDIEFTNLRVFYNSPTTAIECGCFNDLVISECPPYNVTVPQPREIDLRFQRVYHPFGFRLNLATNSAAVVDAAEENWGMYEPQYGHPPLTLRVVVQADGELSPPPVHVSQNHRYSLVAGRENYAVAGFDALFAYICVTQRTVADHTWFRWFYLDAMAGILLAQRHAAPIHAACVERNGIGVLLCGPSGMGKSTLAYACARAGWTFVADDACILPQSQAGCTVTGRPHLARLREDAPRLFPELKGYETRARPTGKLSIEIPMASLPGIRTAARSEVKRMVFLDRGNATKLGRMGVEHALQQMLQYSRDYAAETQVRHEKALRRLLPAPPYHLQYERLQEAVAALEDLTA
jgi:hypothetical protein